MIVVVLDKCDEEGVVEGEVGERRIKQKQREIIGMNCMRYC